MREIKLTQGQVALVDADDYNTVEELQEYHWSAMRRQNGVWHAFRNDRGRVRYMHSAILRGGRLIDHRDRNGLNNQKSNLRRASKSQNAANSKTRSDNTSGFKGVSWEKSKQRWCAALHYLGFRYQIGRFTTKEEAAFAYGLTALAAFGEFARL